MQKWCPEPLAGASGSAAGFESTPLAAAPDAAGDQHGFRPEQGFAAADGLLRSLSRDERAQVMALLEQDLRREYEQRHQESTSALETAAHEAHRAATEALAQWQAGLATALRQEIDATLASWARRLGEIAVLMATRVVRREVQLDPQILVRAVETVLFKAEAGRPLTVTAHPDDAAWLEQSPELRDQLRISAIKTDRRVERGGCLVHSDQIEWDATVERQLAVLGEVVDEALAQTVASSSPEEEADG